MRYRVILPAVIPPGQALPAVYLLHGAGGGYRDWSNNSDVAQYAEAGLILIMPQGDYSYYVNAVGRANDRYEDYLVQDLPAEVEAKFPAAKDRANRAIVGISMGGFGALEIAFSHPELFAFSGALSPAVDACRRPFSWRRPQQSWEFRTLFGPSGRDENRRRDPFFLAREIPVVRAPFVFLSCGDSESLLPPNREFAALLAKQRLPFEFHLAQGGHDWYQWTTQLPGLFEALHRHVGH
jgi:S-formylglutathione hydrolase FrmB